MMLVCVLLGGVPQSAISDGRDPGLQCSPWGGRSGLQPRAVTPDSHQPLTAAAIFMHVLIRTSDGSAW